MTHKILITGGAGYIGSHVALEFIKNKSQVTILDNLSSGFKENVPPKSEFILGDINDKNLLHDILKTSFDAVIHLAASKAAGESMHHPEKYTNNNIIGSLNLLDAIINSNTNKFIFSSSAAVYGAPQYLPIDEKHPLDPINFYGFTKLEIERFLKWYDQLTQLKHVSLRYFNAAGYDRNQKIMTPEKNPANLIPILMDVLIGKRSEVDVYGNNYDTDDGSALRDYIHVTDLAKAHYLAFEWLTNNNQSKEINLGTGKSHSVLDIIKKLEVITGKTIPYKITERRPGDAAELTASSLLAKELFNWDAKHSDIENILKTTWNIYKDIH